MRKNRPNDKPASPPLPPVPGPSRRVWALAAALFALQAVLGLRFISSAAPTYDEAVHLASGHSYLATGRYRLNINDHPPLAEMWAALPLLALGPNLLSSHPDWLQGRVYHYSDQFLYHNRVPAERMMNLARAFNLLTWGAAMAAALLLWAHRLAGPPAALAAVGVAALSPVLVSNLSLVTTDGAPAALFFLVFWLLSAEKRSPLRWAAAGALAGLALAAKFNMILLGPLAAGTVLLDWGLRPKPRPGFPWGGAFLAVACAALALAACYRFDQLPLYEQGLRATLERLGQGRSTFLLGRHSLSGFWLYFPAALGVKTPLPILALAAGALLAWSRRMPGRLRELVWIAVPAGGYLLTALSSRTQIGVRHLLPALPFLALLAGCAAAWLWEAGGKLRWALAGLLAWTALSVGRVGPHLLAYFNEVAGGPTRGYTWLVDSNLDWGQELKGLGAALKELGDPPVYLAYFGCADPSAYGIRYVPLAISQNVVRSGDDIDPAASGRVLLAISATTLQANYLADKRVFDWLKERVPLRVIGYSIFLYDLTGDPEARKRLAELLRMDGRTVGPALAG